MTSRTPGRHRAARRPLTPLTPYSRAAARGIGAAARRGALVAAGSGLLVSVFSAPANAVTSTESSRILSTVDLGALTEEASQALAAAPVVSVSADARFTVESSAVVVTPPPAPEPEPVAEPAAAVEQAEETTQTVAAEPAEEVAVPASAAGSTVVAVAMQYLGAPYLWGGSTPAGFDCSGFTSYVYAQVGIDLPRTSSEQRYAGTVVSRAEAQPGDLIWSPGHIAIYAGDGMQIEAPVPGETVRYGEIWQSSPVFIRVG
ncbi:C40 family peptidase [Antribacter sp. KLBMP9083]|uniref:C40 family peptidase n=1 Tax=Antribacter soli TaxID=2910976 RepID=A0AA41QJ44_9MICO|nr:C40 family peptidase [Antribacter soli]MCF4123651.1 C40 family peptidase [Antribacter soli]